MKLNLSVFVSVIKRNARVLDSCVSVFRVMAFQPPQNICKELVLPAFIVAFVVSFFDHAPKLREKAEKVENFFDKYSIESVSR